MGVEGIADFGSHALLHKRSEFAFIFNLDQFLRPIGRVGYVELHLDERSAVKTGGAKLSVREVGRLRSSSSSSVRDIESLLVGFAGVANFCGLLTKRRLTSTGWSYYISSPIRQDALFFDVFLDHDARDLDSGSALLDFQSLEMR